MLWAEVEGWARVLTVFAFDDAARHALILSSSHLSYIYIYIDTLIHGTYVVIHSYIHIYTHSCSYLCIYVYMSTAPGADIVDPDAD